MKDKIRLISKRRARKLEKRGEYVWFDKDLDRWCWRMPEFTTIDLDFETYSTVDYSKLETDVRRNIVLAYKASNIIRFI